MAKRIVMAGMIGLVLVSAPSAAHADILRGLTRIVGGVLEVPMEIFAGTASGPPILGTVVGAVAGVVKGSFMVLSGALETTISAIPIAAKLAPYIPIFM